MIRRRPALAALLCCGFVAWFMIGPPGTSSSAPSSGSEELSATASDGASPATQPGDTEGLGSTETGLQRRREEWVARQVSDDDLSALPGWAGAWVDSGAGARVTFSANDADTVFNLAAAGYPDWVTIRPVAYSLLELEPIRQEAEALVQDHEQTSVDLSIEFNLVVATVAPRSPDALMLIEHFQGEQRLIVQSR